MRHTWDELPSAVRTAIEHAAGHVERIEIPKAGRNSDFSATLHVGEQRVFCKGIADADGPRGRMHRHEAEVNPCLPPVAPQLLWRTEASGWLLLGFEHVSGQHANLAPGSPDLPVLAEAVEVLTGELVDSPVRAPQLGDQWARLAAWRRLAKDTPHDLDEWARDNLDHLMACEMSAIDLVRGDSLAHTDLHSLNILVSHSRVRVVDWAWSRKGAPSVDVAFLIIRLIAAGHAPAAAEEWANTMPLWRMVPAAARTAFAVAIWGMWEFLEREEPMTHRGQLTAAARSWARYRLR